MIEKAGFIIMEKVSGEQTFLISEIDEVWLMRNDENATHTSKPKERVFNAFWQMGRTQRHSSTNSTMKTMPPKLMTCFEKPPPLIYFFFTFQ